MVSEDGVGPGISIGKTSSGEIFVKDVLRNGAAMKTRRVHRGVTQHLLYIPILLINTSQQQLNNAVKAKFTACCISVAQKFVASERHTVKKIALFDSPVALI